MADESKKNLNPAQETELQGLRIFIPLIGVIEQFGSEDLGAILHGLHSKGLIGYFQYSSHKLEDDSRVPYLGMAPTSLGVQLFAVANNMFPEWYSYSTSDFGDFPNVTIPKYYANSLNGMLEQAGLKKPAADPGGSIE